MSVVAAAIATSAVVGAYAVSEATKAQEKGLEKATGSQERMSAENLAFQKEIEASQREDFAPWQEAGETALGQIMAGVESGEFDPGRFTPENINLEADPGYQFRLEQGTKALERGASAKGKLLGGAQQKALLKYGQDLGSQEYGNAYARALNEYQLEAGRKRQKFNILSGISGTGQASAARMAGATSQLGSSVGNIYNRMSDFQGRAAMRSGDITANQYRDYATIANQAAQNWLLYNRSKQPAKDVAVKNETPLLT